MIILSSITILHDSSFTPRKSIVSRYGKCSEWYKKMMRKLRKEKLNKLKNIF